MKHTSPLSRFAGLAAFAALAGIAQASLPFTVGNLVVVRIGDGTAVLTNSSTATFLEEFTVGGAPVTTLAMPIAPVLGNQAFTNSGTSTSEGFLTVSGAGSSSFLFLGGYGAAPGSIGSITSSASSVVPRVVARVDLAGTIDTTTALGDAYSGGNIRSACSDNGAQFWTSGTSSMGNGIRYGSTLGATTSIMANLVLTNTRVTDIASGQLYCTSASGSYFGVSAIGIGLPTTIANPTTLLNGFPSATGPSSYDFYFADAAMIYLADDRTSVGGIQKWTDVLGTWTLQYTLQPAVGVGCRGLTASNVAGTVTLYATTTQSNANSIVTVVDTGASALFTTIATAPMNTAFRGIRFLAGNASTPSTSFCSGDAVGTTCVACGNNGAAGRGCANSSFANGALLASSGVASVGSDTLVLTASDIPGPGLFFQANGIAGSPIPFGDGMLCASVGITRLGVVFPTAGSASFPGGLTPNPISVGGGPIAPGSLKHYQCWYRDAAVFCTASTFNTSNGVSLTWGL